MNSLGNFALVIILHSFLNDSTSSSNKSLHFTIFWLVLFQNLSLDLKLFSTKKAMYKKFNVLLGDWIASVAKKGFWFQFWIPVIFALKPGLRSWLRQHKKVLSKKSMYVSADKKDLAKKRVSPENCKWRPEK